MRAAASGLRELHGVGVEITGRFLVTAGDNASGSAARPRSPSTATSHHSQPAAGVPVAATGSAAAVTARPTTRCTSSPSSGYATTSPTRDYVERRTAERLSKREMISCPKRYIAREVSNLPRQAMLTAPVEHPPSTA